MDGSQVHQVSVAEAKAALVASAAEIERRLRDSTIGTIRRYALPLVVGSAAFGLLVGSRKRKGSAVKVVASAAAKRAIPIVLPFALDWVGQMVSRPRGQAGAAPGAAD